MFRFLQKILGRRPAAEQIAAPLWESVEAAQPWLARLSPEDRAGLRALALAFLDDKSFSGAHGYEPDNTARLSIALQACLPVLRLGLTAYSGWRGIVVYPDEFIIPRRIVDEDGVLHEYEEDALGEAWDGGPVVLAWSASEERPDGINVVIHEFAHKLDMLAGEADGMPPLHANMSRDDWRDTLDAAFDDFSARVDMGEETGLDPYAAEHPAEFFAVCSEAFFTQPEILLASYPDFYQQLALFYRFELLNPAATRDAGGHSKI